MSIHFQKIELIKLIEINSEAVLKKIKGILTSSAKKVETDKMLSNPAMVKRLNESKQQISKGKGVKVSLDDIWK